MKHLQKFFKKQMTSAPITVEMAEKQETLVEMTQFYINLRVLG